MRRAGARAPDEGTEQHLAVRAGLAMGPPATQEEGKEFAFAGKALGWASGMLPFGSLLTSFFFLVQGPPDAWSRGGAGGWVSTRRSSAWRPGRAPSKSGVSGSSPR